MIFPDDGFKPLKLCLLVKYSSEVYESQLLDLCAKFNSQILSNSMMEPKVLKFAKKKAAALDNYLVSTD